MPSNFEQLIFEILATDKNASAAFDRFRQKVDQTSRSVDDNSKSMDKNAKSIDNVGKSASSATPLVGGLGGVSGMGALIGAGVALSPILATVGVGLAGFGAAAIGVAKPVLDAAQKTGGLKAHMDELGPAQKQLATSLMGLGKQYQAFSKSLQPEVLAVFGKGIQIAGHLMADVEPIARATGKALDGLLGRVDAEFQSGTWQKFFTWMAANVGPDFQLIGNLVIDLLNSLPRLLELLQPVATGFLKLADGAVKAADAYVQFIAAQNKKAGQPNTIKTQIEDFLKYGYGGHKAAMAAAEMAAQQDALNKRLIAGHAATADLIHPIGTFQAGLKTAKVATDNEKVAVQQLTGALQTMSTGLLTTQQNQITWRQAQQAATQAIKANTGSLDSNRATALTARAAIIQSTQAAITFANQEVKVHHNTDAASKILQAQITYLKNHAGHSKVATEELRLLIAMQQRLRNEKPIHESIFMTGKGKWGIFGPTSGSGFINAATGGRVPGAGTGDTVPAMLTPGEAIVPKHLVPALVPFLKANQVPGFAAGGPVNPGGGIIGSYGGSMAGVKSWTAHNWNASITTIENSMANAMAKAFAKFGGGRGSGAIVRDAMHWLGRIPYVWGGTAVPGGADCSGFVETIYGRHGLSAPRTSEAQGAWVRRGPPVPGGLAFYHSPAGGPDPGHVAIIGYGGNVISQGGGMGPQYTGLRSMPLLWTGVPPRGFDQGGYLPPGPTLAWNGTGRAEAVVGGAPLARVEALLAQLLAAVRVAPAATSAGTARALNSAARGAMR